MALPLFYGVTYHWAALAEAGGLRGILAPVTLWGARVSAGAAWQGLRAAGAALAVAGGMEGSLVPVTLWGARVSAGAVWQGYVLLGLRRRWRLG